MKEKKKFYQILKTKYFQQKILNQNLNHILTRQKYLSIYPSFLLKDLYYIGKTMNKKIVNNFSDGLIKLRSAIDRKKITNNENPEKVIVIVKEILNVNKKQKRKWFPSNFDCANLNKYCKDYQ